MLACLGRLETGEAEERKELEVWGQPDLLQMLDTKKELNTLLDLCWS